MAQQVQDNSKFTGIRLPTHVKPVHYDLTVKPDLKKFTFTGSVKIDYLGEQGKLNNEVVVHAADLEITKGHVESDGKPSPLSTVFYSQNSQTATLAFADTIPQRGTIVLDFNGTLNDQMKGFYRTQFKISKEEHPQSIEDDTQYTAATTQFESTDARRCFPCWDEPAVKAEFTLTVFYQPYANDNKLFPNVALSNMPVVESGTGADCNWVKFDKTPKMSTYLLAIIVGPFEQIENTAGRQKVGVYTTPGKKEQGRFALEVACKALKFYEDYFKVDYPLKKSDLIAIPDFASGAMENWGLVTYRESCLLVDPKNTSTQRKHWIALVVAHELAHQWFGNLVTMEWWTHLWLNEGFASFMEYLCVDRLYPEFEIMTQFTNDTVSTALNLDSLRSSHPIEVPVNHPDEIQEIFDAISYDKGSSIIRMMYEYIGDDDFRKGMNDYLNKFAYSNASTEDLWDSLGKASNKPVRELMSGWTSQTGFPWLSVTLSDETKQEGNKLKLNLTQSKFVADGKLSPEDSKVKWQIPISALTGAAPTKPILLDLLKDKQGEVTVDLSGNNWVKINAGSVGFYRVAYPEELIRRLLPAIQDQTLNPIDRLNLQSDYFALCKAGNASTVELLKILEAFKNESTFVVWKSIDASVSKLSALLRGTDSQEKFHAYGRALYSEIFKKLTWRPQKDESNTESMLRSVVINRLVAFGEPSVIEEAKQQFKAHLDQSAPIPADLRAAVYKAVATYGDVQGFNSLINIYKTSSLSEEKNRILAALGQTRDPELIKRAIEFDLSDEVKIQDKVYMFSTLAANNPSIAFKAFQDNIEFFKSKLTGGHLLAFLVKAVCQEFTTDQEADQVESYFNANVIKSCDRSVKQVVETIRGNASWLARDLEAIGAFLNAK